jgi:alkaline phosphatase
MRGANSLPGKRYLNRRAFLHRSGLILAGASAPEVLASIAMAGEEGDAPSPELRLGLMTDIHHAERDPAGTRHYRDSLLKVREAVRALNDARADRLIHLGDLIDAGDTLGDEIGHLKTIEAELAQFQGERHYVLGNHCVSKLTKEEFLEHTAARSPHTSFDQGPFHFVILDACFRADGVAYGRNNFNWTDANIPSGQLDWLGDDLERNDKPTLIFVHQRLDGEGHPEHMINNAADVRALLRQSGKVLAVIAGHSHQNAYHLVDDIHYCVLRAVVEGPGAENSGYATMDLFADTSIRLTGFRKQASYTPWRPRAATTKTNAAA